MPVVDCTVCMSRGADGNVHIACVEHFVIKGWTKFEYTSTRKINTHSS